MGGKADIPAESVRQARWKARFAPGRQSYPENLLTIVRKGSDKPIEVTIVRDIIRVKSVRSRPEGADVGYIRVTQFNEQTTDNLKQAINDLNSKLGADKIRGYILDLRNNPGGAAIDRTYWGMQC